MRHSIFVCKGYFRFTPPPPTKGGGAEMTEHTLPTKMMPLIIRQKSVCAVKQNK